jgi:hypothetical protein
MAARAQGRLCPSFDVVTQHEITAVYKARLNPIRPAFLNRQLLSYVVTRVTRRFRVTSLAQLLLLHRKLSMATHERAFMSKECLGK